MKQKLIISLLKHHWLLLRNLFTLLLAITIGLLFLSIYFINILRIQNGFSSSTSTTSTTTTRIHRTAENDQDDPWWQWFRPNSIDIEPIQQSNQSYFHSDNTDIDNDEKQSPYSTTKKTFKIYKKIF
ncbi:hypothetical protein DERP_009055 [Dermatophagoides pteronyssinus]|uniref:Uncharacterized protein n=1 Tax=Dermatophagoides pteronyssinus TaxID=6956 RepID=A0ABQ8JGB4_DERPT|nr:hypothetical protein DERP_009055 [Dermatophagoides pteronyssinus]